MLTNLKKLREIHAVTQKTLADAVGVSQQSINKYENHHIEPDIETLCRIADYFNTSVDFLIGHTDIPNKIEMVHDYQLNDEESRFINGFRQLNTSQKESIAIVINNYINK